MADKQFQEYLVIEADSTTDLKRLVEQSMNADGYKLHGGVSSSYVPPVVFPNGEERCPGGWVFHQSMVRGEGGRKHAYRVRNDPGYTIG